MRIGHVSDDRLSLVALGEDTFLSGESAHLEGCLRCRSNLDQLLRAVTIARTLETDDFGREFSKERVWQRIEAEIGRGTEDARDPRRVRRRRLAVVAVAAATLLVGVATAMVLQLRDTEQLYRARLQPLQAGNDASGTARVVKADDRLTLEVSLADIPGPGDNRYHELWLLGKRDGNLMLVSLGPLRSESIELPRGIDLDFYRTVDVSVEPLDGDPSHSGDSTLRGELRPA